MELWIIEERSGFIEGMVFSISTIEDDILSAHCTKLCQSWVPDHDQQRALPIALKGFRISLHAKSVDSPQAGPQKPGASRPTVRLYR
jgi:hypothetical protein